MSHEYRAVPVMVRTSAHGHVFGIEVAQRGANKVTLTTSDASGWRTATRTAAYEIFGTPRGVSRVGEFFYTGLDGARKVSVDYELTPQPTPEKCPTSGRTAAWCTDQTHEGCGTP